MSTLTYRGKVSRVFFSAPDGSFLAGVLLLDDAGAKQVGSSDIRFSAKLAARAGDKIEITGTWKRHPKFGNQFEAETGIVKMDESPEALAHLLASDDRFAGLGAVRARKVVDAALHLSPDGDLASALAEYAEEIAGRSGVKLDVVQNAARVWGERRGYFDALAHLVDQGWSNAQAHAIVTKFGENAPAIVKQDPYALIGRIARFGFRTVDAVALKIGVAPTDPQRLAAGLAYCLDQMSSNGNTWAARDALIDAALLELRPDSLDGENALRRVLDDLILAGAIYSDRSNEGFEMLADPVLASAEFEVFGYLLKGLANAPERADERPISLEGPRAAAIMPTLNSGQRAAVMGAWEHQVSLISGGAGVGKTYTMRAICEIAEENGLSVALCAPTGKAARKLATATGRQAMTIHRLLEPMFDEETGGFRFKRGPKNEVEALLVVVDEVSMVDVRLMRSLIRALSSGCRLILVGDHHQIPSVSPGAVLRDLLAAADRYPAAVNILTEIVRQAGDLAKNTTAILGGVISSKQGPSWGIEHMARGHEEGAPAIVARIVESVATAPEALEPFGRKLDLAWDIQVLSPMKKGPLGTYALNAHLQRLRQRLLGNPVPEPIGKDERPQPLAGDRVIWTKNDYELELFNGTQGVVMHIKKGKSMLLILEDGREVEIPWEKKQHIEVAYAMTIHKSQGSEWPFVVLVGSSSHWIMHDRNLLYTGASRAAEALTIVGDQPGLRHFAQERKSAMRQTFGALLVHGWAPRNPALAAAITGEAAQQVVDTEG